MTTRILEFGGDVFQWDERKAQANLVKHGIDFLDALMAFRDPHGFTYRSRQGALEVRFIRIGSLRGRVIAVIFTRRGESIRIISARAARRSERQSYG